MTVRGAIVASGKPQSFTFDRVFGPGSTQEEFFETSGVKNLLDSVLDGYYCTAFAFGQTGSGKTYTITGPDALNSGDLGVIQRSFAYLMDEAAKRDDTRYLFSASYLEIYNEQVLDLLNPFSGRGALQVRWRASDGFYVENLFTLECATTDDLLAILEEGLQYRQTSSHEMNERSSRSHSILTVHVESIMITDDEYAHPIRRRGKMSFVDLAGSERVKETKSEGQMLVETTNINKSLLTLGHCISSLADPKKRAGHIPFRDSTLTMLLKDNLGGSGMTLMIACVSPATSSALESTKTLRYASRAKRIQNKVGSCGGIVNVQAMLYCILFYSILFYCIISRSN